MNPIIEGLTAVAILSGAVFALIGALGLVRLPDFHQRLHGPTKASTLGVGGVVLGTVLHFSWQTHTLQLQALLIVLFVFMTAPITAHMLAKAARHRGLCGAENEGKTPADDRRGNVTGRHEK